MLLLTLLLLATSSLADSNDNRAPSQIDCKAERVALLRTLKPVINPDATLESKEDADPTTVQFFYIKDLPVAKSHVSEDGQVIYISRAIAEDANAVAKLFAAAVDRLLVLKLGAVCPPLQVPAAGT